MKTLTNTIALLLLLGAVACQQKHDHAHDDVEDGPNKALYDEVMDVHNEVMPRMDDLYKAKTTLQTRLAMPGLGEKEKEDISSKIARLDSASEGMMVWMRQFEPLADSVGEEKARTYLEAELVKVKKVREDIQEALEATAAEKSTQ
ncbi:MAG: hypothetical protein M3Y60_04955 [Bacteroidota bacterium]|nr:hypothetical protein [Bacteroidota bacterium]